MKPSYTRKDYYEETKQGAPIKLYKAIENGELIKGAVIYTFIIEDNCYGNLVEKGFASITESDYNSGLRYIRRYYIIKINDHFYRCWKNCGLGDELSYWENQVFEKVYCQIEQRKVWHENKDLNN